MHPLYYGIYPKEVIPLKTAKAKKAKRKGKKPNKRKVNFAPLKRELRSAFVSVCALLLYFAGTIGVVILAMYLIQYLGLAQ